MRVFLTGMVGAVMMLTPAVDAATVLFNDTVVEVEQTLDDPNDLWVRTADLTRVNRFELKPEGACLDEICIPVLQDRDSDMFVTREGEKWFNVTELARKLNQPFVADAEAGVWSFGSIPATRASFLQSVMAPDFELKDRQGNVVRLSDYRGKKVIVFTWASW